MRLLFLTTTLPRFAGDSQSPFVLEQAAAWKKERPGDEVIILAPGDVNSKPTEIIEDIIVERFDYFWPRRLQLLAYPAIVPNIKRNPLLILQLPFLFLSELFTVYRLLFKYKVDLLYAHWVVPQGLISLITYNVKRVTYIVHNHSADLRLLVKIPLIGKFLARKIIQNSKYFFCVNETLRREALSLFNQFEQKTISHKIEVMTMGIAGDLRSQMPDQHQSRLLRPVGPRNDMSYDFGFLGRLTEKKGITYFMDTVVKLNSKISVGIAGDGEEMQNIKIQISNIKGNKLQFDLLGHVNSNQKMDFLCRTKVFVFPSLPIKDDVEGLPVALLEALSANKIVVASRATNIEQMSEWENIKSNVLLLKDPTNLTQFATILSSALQKEPKDISKWMRRYEWRSLIKEYTKLLNPTLPSPIRGGEEG